MTGNQVEFAEFRPSGMLAQAILAREPADVYVSANVRTLQTGVTATGPGRRFVARSRPPAGDVPVIGHVS
jgi:ABC-type molybdate transport system substrate-binding protein